MTNKRPRILLATNIFPPDIGGPATFIDDLGAVLAANGYDISVVCFSKQRDVPDDTYRNFPVYRVPYIPGGFSRPLMNLTLFRLLRHHDVVFCNTLENYVRPLTKWLGIPYILKIVGDTAWETAQNRGKTTDTIDTFQSQSHRGHIAYLAHKRRLAAQKAYRVITPSQYLKRIVSGWDVTPNKINVVYNGVRLNEFTPYAPKQRKTAHLKMIFVGRLVRWKGLNHILEAMVRVENISLDVVGGGPEHDTLRAFCLSHSLPVTFLGNIPRYQVKEKIHESDVLLLPSSYEGLSHTLIEACAVGVPCITSTSGGNPEVITHNETGITVPYGDVKALQQAIYQLRDDEDMRYTLAKQAKKSSYQFDFNTTVEQTIKEILSAV